MDAEAELKTWASVLPFSQMTMEDYAEAFPDRVYSLRISLKIITDEGFLLFYFRHGMLPILPSGLTMKLLSKNLLRLNTRHSCYCN